MMTPRLFLNVASMEARKSMSYRVDFWINAVFGFVISVAVMWYLWKAIFAESGSAMIGGYTFEAMIYYYVLVFLVQKVVRGDELDHDIADDIYQGHLTRYLVYPTYYFGFRYAQKMGSMTVGFAQLVLFGVVAPFVLTMPENVHVGAMSIALALVSVLVAHLLNFVMSYPVQGIAFWADQVWSLNVVMRFLIFLFGGLMMPLTLYPDWAYALLLQTPFPYMFYVPVRVLMGEMGSGEWAYGLAITGLWIGLIGMAGRLLWRRGYQSYTGVGI
jgi:ABC-2 type transport system permease protein